MPKYSLPPLPTSLSKYNVSLAHLSNLFKEEFEERASDLTWLAEATRMAQELLMLKDGVTPPWFVYNAMCSKCGPIKLAYKERVTLAACPFCLSEKKPETKAAVEKKVPGKRKKLLEKYV